MARHKSKKNQNEGQHPRLPVELVRLIASIICKDGHSASACASVCKTWRNASRAFVFYSIYIPNFQRYQEFLSRLESEPLVSIWITELHISFRHFYRPPLVPKGPFLTSSIPDELAPKLSELRKIHIDCNVSTDGPEFISKVAQFRQLQVVELEKCNSPLDRIVALTNALPHLRDLRVRPFYSLASPSIKSKTQLSLHTLDVWCLHTRPCLEIIQWITASNTAQTLTSLRILITSVEAARAIRDLLQSLGPTIKHLDLEFAYQENSQALERYHEMVALMDYSRNPGLQSVVLYQIRKPQIFTFLAQLSLTDVQKITFHFPYFQRARTIQGKDYKALDQRLTAGDFSRLQHVIFKCDVHLPLYEVTAKLRRVFHALASAGPGLLSAEVPENTLRRSDRRQKSRCWYGP